MRFFRILIVAIVVATSGQVLAQTVYRWVDDDGRIHYGHAVPPEYADQGYDVLGRDGSVRERVEPALSPEELARQREQQRRQQEEEQRQRSREARDRLLLATYRNEEALAQSMQAQLAALNSQRAATRSAIEHTERRFENLVAQAAEHSRNQRRVPRNLEESITRVRAELRRLRTDLAALDQRESRLREDFQQDLERYRELTGRNGDD